MPTAGPADWRVTVPAAPAPTPWLSEVAGQPAQAHATIADLLRALREAGG
ncbi:MAG: hypothetical protein WKG07_00680 [Hymenobacter sp.]